MLTERRLLLVGPAMDISQHHGWRWLSSVQLIQSQHTPRLRNTFARMSLDRTQQRRIAIVWLQTTKYVSKQRRNVGERCEV